MGFAVVVQHTTDINAEQDVAAKLAELDLVVADLNRANERVATVERRNELLRSEIETVRSGSQQAEK